MDSLHQWELRIISAVQQSSNPFLDNMFLGLTMLGDELFYLLILPILLWNVDRRFGGRVAILFLLSAYMNIVLKELFHQPRPFEIDPTLGIGTADGFGLPSGHAQLAVVVWGSIACRSREVPIKLCCGGLILLIGFSRIYLGVHFPTDVAIGWLLGFFCLGVSILLTPKIEAWLDTSPLKLFTPLFAALLLTLFVLYPVRDTATVIGSLLGMGIGFSLMHRYVSYEIKGNWIQHGGRILLGSITIFVFFFGLRLLLPEEDVVGYLPFRLARYGIIGLWATLGAPWLFLKLGLNPPHLADARPG